LTDPKLLKIVTLAGKKGLPLLRATWNPGLGLVVSGQKLQDPWVNRTLQLWLIPKAAEAKPVPSLTWRPRADGNFFYWLRIPRIRRGRESAAYDHADLDGCGGN
jgi:hypothetical protein